jgi:ariadne-1
MGDEEDFGFDSQDKMAKPERAAYEVPFKVFSPKDIDAAQEALINEVKDVLGQPPESTAILLRYYRWNKERLLDAYMERQDDVLEAAGLGDDNEGPARIQTVPGFCCDICFDDDADMATFALKCGHRFCLDCYTKYLTSKIKDEGEAARIKCPGEACNRIVDSKSLELLLAEDLKPR